MYEKKKLDPVGKEDGDVDNDGDKDSSDQYLMKRRKAIAKAMKKEHHQKDADGNIIEHDGEEVEEQSMEERQKSLKTSVWLSPTLTRKQTLLPIRNSKQVRSADHMKEEEAEMLWSYD